MSKKESKEKTIKSLEEKIKELQILNEVSEYELSATLSKNVNLDEVVNLTLSTVMTLIKAERGCLMFWDRDTNELYIKAEKGPDSLPFGLRRLKAGEGIAGWAFETGEIYVVNDVNKESRFVKSPSGQEEIKSIICVPLMVEDSKIGVINIGTIKEYHNFTEDEIKTLRLIASRASLVIENVHLREKEEEYIRQLKVKSEELEKTNERLNKSLMKLETANKELSSLFDISVSLGSSLDMDKMLSSVFDKIKEFCGASAVAIALLQEDNSINIRASVGLQENRVNTYRLAQEDINPDYFNLVFQKQKTLFFRDINDDALGEYLRKKVLIRPDTRSFYIFPLVFQDKTSGVMTVSFTTLNSLSQKKLKFLKTISNHLAVVLENVRLFIETIAKKNELNAIVHNMGDGVLTFDRDKKITSFNKAAERITGIKREDVMGKSYTDILELRTEEGKYDLTIDNISTEADLKWEGYLTTPDGMERFISAIPTSLKGSKNIIEEGIVVIRDFSKEKEVEQLKSDFVSYVAHELRSPLTSIKGYTSILIHHGESFCAEKKKEFFDIINNEVDRLTRLIKNLLDLSRIEAGKFDICKVEINIPALAEKVINTNKISAIEHTMVKNFSSDFPSVYADTDQIEQSLNNLVSNSIKYSPEGGEITIGGEFDKEKVIIYVQDEGPGIPPERADKIFEKFYRITGKDGTKIVGTGLGLFITRTIINAHGGDIWVTSGPAGKGSRFYFSLPYNLKE
ncbi:MAG TPA: GAF domain-containing protein [Candidatus Eremiobacteraeota bacterium]|nr:GAF domain-containing protein [Candidatus Eremiobacteraeota bacterium]